MKKFTIMIVVALLSILGIAAQNVTLPYFQDFSSLANGSLESDAASSSTAVAAMPEGIASVVAAHEAGGAIRIGTESEVGGFTTTPIDAAGTASIKVAFKAASAPGATQMPAKINVSYGSQTLSIDLPALSHSWPVTNDDFERYSIQFAPEATSTAIVVTTIAEDGKSNSVVVDYVKITEVTGVPLSESFENTYFPPEGWQTIHISGNMTWRRDTTIARTGSACAKSAFVSRGHENWLITPKLNPVAGESFSYWIRGTLLDYAGHNLYVKVSTNSDNVSDFTTLLKIHSTGTPTVNLSDQWVEYTLDLSAYAGQEIYIAFHAIDNDGGTIWLDDISGPMAIAVDCPSPTSVVSSDITSNSANISWQGVVGVSNYVVEYSTSPIFENSISSSTASANGFILTDLTPSSNYYVRVKSDCLGDDYSIWSVHNFRTACATLTDNLTESFVGSSSTVAKIPDCWTRVQGTASNLYATGISGHDDSNSIIFSASTSTSVSNDVLTIVTPKFSEPLSTLYVHFWLARSVVTDRTKFEVGVVSDPSDPSTFVLIEDVSTTTTTWTRRTVNLIEAPATHKYIAFRMVQTGTTSSWFSLDEVEVVPKPSCMEPSRITAAGLIGEAASITFFSEQTGVAWIVEHKETSASEWIVSEPIDTTLYQLTNLSPETEYMIRVKTVCSATDQSEYSNVATFTTTCATRVLPFFEDFESTSLGCWQKSVTADTDVFEGNPMVWSGTSYWTRKILEYGINSPRMVANIYGTRKAWLVTPVIALSGQEKRLEFDVAYTKYNSGDAAQQSGYDDKFMVAIGTIGDDLKTVWSAANATVWNNDGTGNHILNDLSVSAQRVIIDLAQYSGNIRIGFYIGSIESNADNDLHLDNILVREFVVVAPTVVTQAATDVNNNSATLHKEVTQGTYPIAEEGFYYKAESDAEWTMSTDGMLNGLTVETLYKFYAYAKVENTIYSGDTLQLTTTNVVASQPTVTTLEATNITQTTATLNKTVVPDQHEAIATEGWKYRKVGDTEWITTTDGNITGLIVNGQYEFYAFATTVTYPEVIGATLNFSTLIHNLPTVTTMAATNIKQTTATLQKSVTPGTEPVTAEGWKYRKVGDTEWIATTGGGIAGLTDNSQYEFYAFATTATYPEVAGTTLNFSTLAYAPPTVTTGEAIAITQTSAILNKTVMSGTETIATQGWKYRKVGDAEWITTANGGVVGLTPNTQYEFYAFATTVIFPETAGATLNFTTLTYPAPTVTTRPATDITQNSAKLNKTVSANQSEPIIEEGWKYRKVGDAEWITTADGNITGLTENTQYEFYAYATTVSNPETAGATLNFTTQTVGLDMAQYNVKLYPNPAKDIVVLMIEGIGSDAKITVVDSKGKIVGNYRMSLGSNQINIDVSSFVEGNYVVNIVSSGVSITERLIVRK